MRSQTAALAAGSVASFLVPFMMSAVAITLPVVQNELGATAVELSWVAGSYILVLAAILLPAGRLADIMGRRRTFVAGVAAFVVFSLLASMAWSVISLVALRILQGVGAAMILSTGVAIVTDVFPRAERGKAMGILVACVYLGLSVGPLVGGFMTDLAGWRSVFFLSLPPGLACWLLALRIQGEWRPAEGEHFDLLGTLYYSLFVISFVNGLTGLARPERGLPLLLGAGALGMLFVLRSRRAAHPIIDLSLFTSNRVFVLSSLATLINYAGTFAVSFMLSLYLQVVKGFSPMNAGFILVLQPVVQSLLSPLAGTLSDRFNAAGMASLGMAFCALGLFGMCRVDAGTSLWTIGGLLALLGVGFALFASPNMSVIMGSVQPRHYSIASSLVGTMRTFGMSLSMGIATVVFGFLLHGRQVSPETVPQFLQSMHIIFAVCAALCVIGVFCSLGRVRGR
jgi:EmrB/QacA subfamily drug resistance transporter